jgi:hypothetical protein
MIFSWVRALIPKIYNTRYSRVLTFYSASIYINKVHVYIHCLSGKTLVRAVDTPHFNCALELYKNPSQLIKISQSPLGFIDKLLKNTNLVESVAYVTYIKTYYPNEDAIKALKSFACLIYELGDLGAARKECVNILVRKKYDSSLGGFWLLIDGLHRTAIMAALGEKSVTSRVSLFWRF